MRTRAATTRAACKETTITRAAITRAARKKMKERGGGWDQRGCEHAGVVRDHYDDARPPEHPAGCASKREQRTISARGRGHKPRRECEHAGVNRGHYDDARQPQRDGRHSGGRQNRYSSSATARSDYADDGIQTLSISSTASA